MCFKKTICLILAASILGNSAPVFALDGVQEHDDEFYDIILRKRVSEKKSFQEKSSEGEGIDADDVVTAIVILTFGVAVVFGGLAAAAGAVGPYIPEAELDKSFEKMREEAWEKISNDPTMSSEAKRQIRAKMDRTAKTPPIEALTEYLRKHFNPDETTPSQTVQSAAIAKR